MKRTTRRMSVVISVALASLFMVMPVLALPPLPSSFYGTVKVNGANVTDGTQIQALINGQVFAHAFTQTSQGNSIYSLDIPGDDTETPAVDGGHEGDIIQFKIDGKMTNQTSTWHSSTNISLNLTRVDVSIPTPIPTKQRQSPFLKSEVVTPSTLTTQHGLISGSPSNLNLLDQTGAEDDPDAYLSFQTPDGLYLGVHSFFLPENAQARLVSTMLLQVNFKGTASATQVWTWSIYNWNSGMWIKIGDTAGADSNEWQTLLFRIRQPWRYISSGKEIRVQLRSNNANGDAKLDYEALHITYLSIPTTPTPVTTPVTPKRPGISSAPSTPRP